MNINQDVQKKLDTAKYFLNKAKARLDSRKGLVRACREINASLNRSMEAWLMKHEYWNDYLNDRDMMKSEFSKHATRILRWKIFSIYKAVYTQSFELPEYQAPHELPAGVLENWLNKIYPYLSDVQRIIKHIGGEISDEITFEGEFPPEYHIGQWIILIEHSGDYELNCLGKVLKVTNHEITVRYTYGEIATIDADWASLKLTDRPDDDMYTIFEKRRTWFDLHPEYRQVPLYTPFYKGCQTWYSTCPCCGYPTLSSNRHSDYDEYPLHYEICPLCDWADEYRQDDHDAKQIQKGANWDYSLEEARKNFEQYGWMFRKDETNELVQITNPSIFNIRSKMKDSFNAMVGESSSGKIYLLWCDVKRHWKELDAELKKREDEFDKILKGEDRRLISYTPDRSYWMPRLGYWVKDIIDGIGKTIWIGEGIALLRFRNGKIRATTMFGSKEFLNIPCSDMYSPFQSRRVWFDTHPEICKRYYTCPCCGYPTLDCESSYETCFLCEWEDALETVEAGGGYEQDDHNADEVLGGSNGNYSLTEARKNFEVYGIMYRPKDDMFDLVMQPAHVEKRKKQILLLNSIIIETDLNKIDAIWTEIEKSWSEK